MGDLFAKAEGLPSVVWDTYFLYGPEARWGSIPASLVASAFPVTRFKGDLRKYLSEVLKGRGKNR